MPDIRKMEALSQMSFEALKEEVESWDLSEVPEYNLPNWEYDDLLVLKAKAIVIYNQLFGV